jgi:hypothetical protein
MITAFRDYQINSKNRISGTNETFTYKMDIPQQLHLTHVMVNSITIPRSYYLVQAGFNTFTLREPGQVDKTITVPKGNYYGTTFTNLIPTLLNAASDSKWVYTLSYPNTTSQSDTGKFTFAVTGNVGVQPSLIMPLGSDINEQLGFDVGSTNTFVGNSIESVNVTKFILEDCLYLHSSLVDDQTDILQEVYTAGTVDFGNITFSSHSHNLNGRKMKAHAGTVVNFALTNEDGHSMNLNGLPMNFSLRLYRLEFPPPPPKALAAPTTEPDDTSA